MLTLSTNHETAGTLENRQKNLNGIDLIKFLCSIMVFMVHIPFFTSLNSVPAKFLDFGLRHCICRIAVPFYFVCSGYFLFRKMPLYDPDAEIIKNYCFRILRLIATWLILLIMGGAYHLWYLSATVVAIVMLSLCLHWRVKYRHICILACLLYMIGLLGDSYYGLIAPLRKIKAFNALIQAYAFVFETTRNGVFMGFIYIFMGASLAHAKTMLKPLPSAIGLAGSVICLLAEAYLLKSHDMTNGYNMYVFLLPVVYFLFSLAYSLPLKDHAVYTHLRKTGVLVFFLHLFVNRGVALVLSVTDKLWNVGAIEFQFVCSLAATVLVAVLIERLSCKERLKWINWLIS